MFPNCCARNPTSAKGEKNASATARVYPLHSFARAIVPAGGLLLLPKCPACLAVYVAIITGVGVSVSAARYLESFLLMMCIAPLAYFAAKGTGGLLRLMYGSSRHASATGSPARASRFQRL